MNKLKEAALSYAARGWAIFPTNSLKEPYTNNGVLDATTNVKKIEKWWKDWPTANIALDVGGANMMVLDLDPGHSIEKLEANVGELPDTKLVATTPRGGEHLYYQIKDSETVPLSQSKLSPHVDVRSFHSYVLLAPSKTKDGAYTWKIDPLKHKIKPAYRTDKMIEVASAVKERSDDYDTWIIEPDLPENLALCAKWLREDAKPAIEGINGDHMAYSTAAMCKSFGISEATALELMWDHWNPRCAPPWGADEIEHLETKVKNGYSYNTSAPGNMTPAYKVAKANELFSPVSRKIKGGGVEVKAGRFRIVDFAGMQEIKPPKWLIKDTIPENSYSLLIGARGTFKTFIALDMALSIATGAPFEDWLGMWPDVKQGPVLFAVGEGRAGLKSRVNAWVNAHNDGEPVPGFYLADPVPHPDEADYNTFIDAALKKHSEYSLVVLDTVGRSMQGLNENSQQDASQFTRMVEEIQYQLDTAVLALHHSGHEHLRARGSSVFGADVDAEFILDRPNEKSPYVHMKNSKQKDGPEWKDRRLVYVPEHGGSRVVFKPNEDQTKQAKITAKKKGDKPDVDIILVRKIAYQEMKKFPGKMFSKSALSELIAQSEACPLGAQALRKGYIDDLLIDKAHPLCKCFDAGQVGKQPWGYVKP